MDVGRRSSSKRRESGIYSRRAKRRGSAQRAFPNKGPLNPGGAKQSILDSK